MAWWRRDGAAGEQKLSDWWRNLKVEEAVKRLDRTECWTCGNGYFRERTDAVDIKAVKDIVADIMGGILL
jgi:hypothetical protein